MSVKDTFYPLLQPYSVLILLPERGLALRGLPGAADTVWALAFMQERFHNASPGDLGGMFMKAGDSKTKKG